MNQKIGFIQALRGWAAVAVMLGHLLFRFFNGNSTVSQAFPYLPESNTGGMLTGINDIFLQMNFDLGPYGVAIFFLISGFVISISLQRQSVHQFAVKRFFKIWPAYIAGFSATFFMIWMYCHFTGTAFPYNGKDWLWQISLLGDWFSKPGIDGIVWTLQAELKFYVFMCLIFALKKESSRNAYRIVSVVMVIWNFAVIFGQDYLILHHLHFYRFAATVASSNINILFMLLGVYFYRYYMKEWSLKETTIMLIEGYFLLILAVVGWRGNLSVYTSSYLIGLLTFLAAHILCQNRKMKICMFFGEISYSLYIVHALNGYIIETVLMQKGVPSVLCLLAAISCAVVMACVLHYGIEKPAVKISGKLLSN